MLFENIGSPRVTKKLWATRTAGTGPTHAAPLMLLRFFSGIAGVGVSFYFREIEWQWLWIGDR